MRFEEPEHKKKDDFEEVFIMNEFLKMNLNDSILRNEEIFAILKERQPNVAREILQGFRAEKLVEAGMSEDLDSAIKFLKKIRGHRSRLGECQESADKYVAQLTDLEYHGFMRMSRARFQSMCEDLEQYWKDKGRYQHPASTPVRFQLAGCLRWLAGGSPHDIIFFCGLRYRTFTKMRWDVLDALIDLYHDKYIKLPENSNEREELSTLFEQKNSMQGILGAIDGLLVHIILPANTKSARKYRCYKQYYALNMQAVAGPNAEFLYVNIGHAGATGDGCASRQSRFWKRASNNDFHYKDGYFFIGDAAYSLMPWMVTPYGGANGVNSKEDVFNLQLSKARQVVERAFGIMIKRWRILVKPLEFKTIEQMAKVIRACAVLHNICTKDSLAAKNDNIIIPQTDARRNPFNVKDPKNGVVPKIRMHLDTYRSTGTTLEERDRAADTQLNKAGKIKRDAIADILHSNGVMRRQKRGRKRAAAYQISADKG